MKYLKRFNESIEDDIVEECKDILLPLVDDGIIIDVIKVGKRYGRIFIKISVDRLPYNLIKYTDDLEHLNSYLESEGYEYLCHYGDKSFSDFLSRASTSNYTNRFLQSIEFCKVLSLVKNKKL